MAAGPEGKWWSKDTLAVVTGGNKGVGYEVVKQLAEHGLSVILTARDEARGSAAAEKLSSAGLNVTFHALDVGNKESIQDFVEWLKKEHGGLDILVNNAGIYPSDYSSIQIVEAAVDVNYWGTVLLTRGLLPLFKSSPAGARVVNVSSELGRLQYLQHEAWREKLADASNLDQETVDSFVSEYIEAARAGGGSAEGWGHPYGVAKLAVNAFTRVLAKDPALNTAGRRLYVNSLHPGLVKTDMNPSGNFTPAEGADTAVWLALLPAGGPTGGFFYVRKEFPL